MPDTLTSQELAANTPMIGETAVTCIAAHERGEHRWEDHTEAVLRRLLNAIDRAGLTIVPDDSPDAYALDCEVPLRLDGRTQALAAAARRVLDVVDGKQGAPSAERALRAMRAVLDGAEPHDA